MTQTFATDTRALTSRCPDTPASVDTSETGQRANAGPASTPPTRVHEEGMVMQVTPALPPSFTYGIDAAGCWRWSGYCDPNGYARIYDRDNQQIVWAHRYSYEWHHGPIPVGHEIDHTCQVTDCVNPDHLDAVTKAEHVARTMDRLGKNDLHQRAAAMRVHGATYAEIAAALGYSGRESAHQAVKNAIKKGLVDPEDVPATPRLTAEQCEDIRELYAQGIPQTVIGAWYRVHASQVSRICSSDGGAA